jgi:hypothetical protein
MIKEEPQIVKNVLGAVEAPDGVFYINTVKSPMSLPEFLGMMDQSNGNVKYIGPIIKKVGGLDTVVVLMEISVLLNTPAGQLFIQPQPSQIKKEEKKV